MPKRALNFAQPGVGHVGDFDDGVADGQARPDGQVLDAEIEVDVELVARERPALPIARDQLGEAGVHHRQLGVVGRRAAQVPAVADEPDDGVEVALVEHLAQVDRRATDDQLDRAAVRRGRADVLEAREKLVGGALVHGLVLARRPDAGQLRADGCRSGTDGRQPARRTATSEGGVISSTARPAGLGLVST